jgi:hypothetical protein
MGFVWQEILSVADRNNGRMIGELPEICETLAQVSVKNYPKKVARTVRDALDFMQGKGWLLVEKSGLLVRNYGEYHKSGGRKESRKGINKTPSFLPSDPSFLNGFSFLWSFYPSPKGSKKDALKEYKAQKVPDSALEALKLQVGYKAECDKRGQFCASFPHLHRWIKKRRWEDEIPQMPLTQTERLWLEGQAEEDAKRES